MARWIKPNININFVGRRKAFWTLSSILVLGSIGMLVANWVMRGDALNYSTDFKGGSEIQIEFSRQVGPADIRGALTRAGFKGAEVVRVSDSSRPHFFMVRLTEVSAFSEADQKKIRGALEAKYDKKNIRRFDYKAGGDKVAPEARLAQQSVEIYFSHACYRSQPLVLVGVDNLYRFDISFERTVYFSICVGLPRPTASKKDQRSNENKQVADKI